MIYLSFNFYYHLSIFCHVVPKTQGTASYSHRQRLDPNFQVSCSVLMFYYLPFHFYLLYFFISFFIFSTLLYLIFFYFLSYFTFSSRATRDQEPITRSLQLP